MSNRKIQLSFNVQTQKKVKIEIGIPQGSPISPILFSLYICNICSQETKRAYPLSYVDDFAITIILNSAKSNCKKLEEIALKLMAKAKKAVISFDISKTKLIYFYNKCIIIEEGLKLKDIKISPKPLVRWLGVFLDSKLTFKQHVETKISKAKAAFYLVKRLGNTQRGLSLQALRQLYIACVTTIADYGIQCWWKSKSKDHLLARYQSLQNEALKLVLGAFKGSPSQAMEIEASIPPPKIRFEKLCNNYALRILKFKENHVIKKIYI